MDIDGKAVDTFLRNKCMSRSDLANKLGVDRSLVTRWLQNAVPIPEIRLLAMARILGVDTLEITRRDRKVAVV